MHSKHTVAIMTKPSATATVTDTKCKMPTKQSKSIAVPDRYSEQIRLCREWEEKTERLNEKYNLDCFSSSELDSESEEGEDYRYKHNYETLI